jgi:exonuclease SbcC
VTGVRLHHLEISAFGPFADTVAVDFDALSDAGLFLLTGATGAGKTSILDAVCFALYGEVPGDRQSAKQLRCDQAPPGAAPRVTLEVSLAGRRFRLVRSPAWERPKKRGSGTTTQQASVTLSERRDGAWQPLSQRLDETGHLVTALLGMNLPQFCQVAMLPQGRFQAFLRARSEERHRLLQQLFRTSRFEDIEQWLRERRRSLQSRSVRHHEAVAGLLSRVSETAGTALPESWDLHDLTERAGTGEVAGWARDVRDGATDEAAATASRAAIAADAEALARAAAERARRLLDLQAAHAAALAEREHLEAQRPADELRRRHIAAARRAAVLRPLQDQLEEAHRERTAASARHTAAVATLASRLRRPADDLDEPTVRTIEQQARDDAAAARAALPREQALEVLDRELASAEDGERHLADTVATTTREAEALDAEIVRLRSAHVEAREAVVALPAARERVEALTATLAAAEEARALGAEVEEAGRLRTTAVDDVHQAKEVWLVVQQQRLEGMAAELAGSLAVGQDCPVCGSHEHPRPAARDTALPDAAAEKAARRRVDDAEAARHAREERLRELSTRLAVVTERADGADRARSLLPAAKEALATLTRTADTLTPLAAEVERVETQLARTSARRDAAAVELAEVRSRIEAARREAAASATEVKALLAGTPAATLAELARLHDTLGRVCREALAAAEDASRAASTAEDAQRRLTAAATAAGFEDVATALAAALDEPAVARLEEEVRRHDRAQARVAHVLADPALRAAAAVDPPDLPELESVLDREQAELAEATAAATVSGSTARRLAVLADELDDALDAWAPVRAELGLTTRLAGLADGTSADNRLRMRLSAYVLAWRLAQVVAAANERLGRMTDGRYSLEHTGRRGAGETRGGLSLLVRDDWSGETRDPATLSGGETFVVSLALALGLADVICHEVGGTDLDTLFVDEGFGSLDAETLDDVMDTLDSLRDGGRVVGVVSHVAEMRDRIPVQLRVTKARSGSSVSVSP